MQESFYHSTTPKALTFVEKSLIREYRSLRQQAWELDELSLHSTDSDGYFRLTEGYRTLREILELFAGFKLEKEPLQELHQWCSLELKEASGGRKEAFTFALTAIEKA